jgi:hypothetical protein
MFTFSKGNDTGKCEALFYAKAMEKNSTLRRLLLIGYYEEMTKEIIILFEKALQTNVTLEQISFNCLHYFFFSLLLFTSSSSSPPPPAPLSPSPLLFICIFLLLSC